MLKQPLLALLALATAGAAHANVIPTLDTITQVGSLYNYKYTADLSADQYLTTGNFFTIYDFQGFSGFGQIASGFTASSSLVGNTPPKVLPTDDPAVTNVTFTFTRDGSINQTMNGKVGKETFLGTFNVLSKYDGRVSIDYTSLAMKNTAPAGTPGSNVGSTEGPLLGSGVPSTVPEPASWALMLAGFGTVGAMVRRRRGSAMTVAA